MKTVKLILKGLLLYTTIIATMYCVGSADSLYDNGYILPVIGIIALLIYVCCKTVTEEDAEILSGNKLFGDKPDDEL